MLKFKHLLVFPSWYKMFNANERTVLIILPVVAVPTAAARFVSVCGVCPL